MGCKAWKTVCRIAPVPDQREGMSATPPQLGLGCACVDISAGTVTPTSPTCFRHPGIASQIINGSPLGSSIQFHLYLQKKRWPFFGQIVVLYSWSNEFQGSPCHGPCPPVTSLQAAGYGRPAALWKPHCVSNHGWHLVPVESLQPSTDFNKVRNRFSAKKKKKKKKVGRAY